MPVVKNNFVRHYDTIGGFYHYILTALAYLTDCGKDDSIFIKPGRESSQVTVPGWKLHNHDNISVYDFYSAVDAIRTIVEEGEGSDPCNPITSADSGGAKDLSHYFYFHTIAEGRGIVVSKKNPTQPTNTLTSNADGIRVDDKPKVCPLSPLTCLQV